MGTTGQYLFVGKLSEMWITHNQCGWLHIYVSNTKQIHLQLDQALQFRPRRIKEMKLSAVQNQLQRKDEEDI